MSQDETPEVEPEKEPKPDDKIEPEVKPEPEVEPEKPKPEAKKEPEVGYVSLRKFAKIFDVSKGTVIRWIKRGQIKGFRTYTGQWRIPRTEVDKVVGEFRTQPAPERPPHLKPKRAKQEEKHDRGKADNGKESEDFI